MIKISADKIVEQIHKNQKKYDDIKRPNETVTMHEDMVESDGEIMGNEEDEI